MSIYLKYRLEKSGISPGDVQSICIYRAEENWIFEDLSAELRYIFPNAVIAPYDDKIKRRSRWQLVFIPFMATSDTLKFKFTALGRVLKLKPRYIGLYELSKRHLVFIKRKSLLMFFIRKINEQMLRFFLRLIKYQ
jgi:hypothetical protein